MIVTTRKMDPNEKLRIEQYRNKRAPECFISFAEDIFCDNNKIKKALGAFESETKEKISNLESIIQKQQEQIDSLIERVSDLDEYSRKPNLIIEGLSESPNENVMIKVETMFRETLGIDGIAISTAHRMCKFIKGSHRSVIVRFVK